MEDSLTPIAARKRSLAPAAEWGALVFALLFPSALTEVYFVALDPYPAAVQRTAYAVLKAIQFLFPAVWVLLVAREPLQWPARPWRGWGRGLALGLVVAGIMLVVYFGWLGPAGDFRTIASSVRGKLLGFGVTTPGLMIAAGAFYALIHSALEEYYWRWFVFGRLRRLTGVPVAILVSSVGFMGHHVIVLAHYFSWPWALAAAACVGIGGALWAWLYQWSGSLVGPWISHLLIDAVIFAIGYDLAFVAR